MSVKSENHGGPDAPIVGPHPSKSPSWRRYCVSCGIPLQDGPSLQRQSPDGTQCGTCHRMSEELGLEPRAFNALAYVTGQLKGHRRPPR